MAIVDDRCDDHGVTVDGRTCKRCEKPCLVWQEYCGAACSAMRKEPYPHLDSEKAEVERGRKTGGEGS